MRRLLLLLTLGFSTAFAGEVAKITPADAAQLVADGKAVLVDIREPAEWAEAGVAAPAVLLPKSDFDGDKKRFAEKTEPIHSRPKPAINTLAINKTRSGPCRSASQADSGIVKPKNSTPIICSCKNSPRAYPNGPVPQLKVNTVIR